MELNQAMLMKIGFTMLMMTVILTFVFALNQMGEKNDFQQYANLEIERHGGLTTEAITNITQYSSNHFDGRFELTTAPTGKVGIFENVVYTYKMKIKPLFFVPTELTFDLEGQATSLVR